MLDTFIIWCYIKSVPNDTNAQNKEVRTLDRYKLEYYMNSKNINKDSICEAIGISKSAFFRKCNGRSEFTRYEIDRIAEVLELSGDDILSIFFADKVS